MDNSLWYAAIVKITSLEVLSYKVMARSRNRRDRRPSCHRFGLVERTLHREKDAPTRSSSEIAPPRGRSTACADRWPSSPKYLTLNIRVSVAGMVTRKLPSWSDVAVASVDHVGAVRCRVRKISWPLEFKKKTPTKPENADPGVAATVKPARKLEPGTTGNTDEFSASL